MDDEDFYDEEFHDENKEDDDLRRYRDYQIGEQRPY